MTSKPATGTGHAATRENGREEWEKVRFESEGATTAAAVNVAREGECLTADYSYLF